MAIVPVPGTELHGKPCMALSSANLPQYFGGHSGRTPAKTPAAPPCVEDSAMATVPVSETEFHEKPCLALTPVILSQPSGCHPGQTPAKTLLHRPVLRIPLWPPFPSLEQNYTESLARRFRLQFCHGPPDNIPAGLQPKPHCAALR